MIELGLAVLAAVALAFALSKYLRKRAQARIDADRQQAGAAIAGLAQQVAGGRQ